MHALRFASKMRHSLSRRTLVASLLFLLAGPPALAARLKPCQDDSSQLTCKLSSVLAMLDTAAWILGVLLVVAIVAAVYAYRRKPRKLTREDILPDDL